jgi:HTH-type transcriptional regulator, competence development regulator
MTDENLQPARTDTLGDYLKIIRLGLHMTLREVEKASDGEVSNAYLSQLENGNIEKPSPHILYALARAYNISYESLMQRAGYIVPARARRAPGTKHGRAPTFAIENLNADEERELLKYLAFYRSKWKKVEKT